MITPVIMPRLGLTMAEGTVLSWLKKEGESVKAGEALLSVETDKVAVDVEAPANGILLKIVVPEGTTVPLERVIAYIGEPGEATPEGSETRNRAAAGAGEQSAVSISNAAKTSTAEMLHVKGSVDQSSIPLKISPIARKLAEEHGIDPSGLQGTGPQGRIVETDIRRVLEKQAKALTESSLETVPVSSQTGQPPDIPYTLQTLSAMRKTTAHRMSESSRSIPHFSLTIEINAAILVSLRQDLVPHFKTRLGLHLTYTDLLLKALALLLPKHSLLNAAYHSKTEIKLYNQVNLGVAIMTGQGLVVGVIRQVDHMRLEEIAQKRLELAAKAQDRRLSPQDISGGTFTLTNLGMYGIDNFYPLINPGQSAILAAGAITERPWCEAGQIVSRPILRLTLAVDHRVADGVDGARFFKDLREMLETPGMLGI